MNDDDFDPVAIRRAQRASKDNRKWLLLGSGIAAVVLVVVLAFVMGRGSKSRERLGQDGEPMRLPTSDDARHITDDLKR